MSYLLFLFSYNCFSIYSRNNEVYLYELFVSYMDNYVSIHFQNHRDKRRNFL